MLKKYLQALLDCFVRKSDTSWVVPNAPTITLGTTIISDTSNNYTAPADGVIQASLWFNGNQGGHIYNERSKVEFLSRPIEDHWWGACVSVKKGDTVSLYPRKRGGDPYEKCVITFHPYG